MIDQLCVKCEEQLKKTKLASQTIKFQHPKLSLGFLYHLALSLQFSFQSIALLADFANERQARNIQIKIMKTNEPDLGQLVEQSYDQCFLQIKFDGKCLEKMEVEYLANAFYSKIKNGMQLILSMFGLGKTGLFINNDGNMKSVILFSVDDRINPNYYKDEAALYFIQENETKEIKNLNGLLMYKIITEGLRIYHPKPQKILNCEQNKMKVVILHPKIFVTNTKIMVYEIRESNLGYDIDTHYNSQKVQFLNKLGYQISIHSQFRLSCYLSCLYLSSSLSFRIGQSEQPICKTNYADYLKTLLQNGALTKIKEGKLNGVSKMQLYQTTEKYVMQNNGILLYLKGRLINRFETEFGRMFEQKFYKKKYRSPPQNIWPILGFIEVDHTKITANLLKNKFNSTFQFRRLIKDIELMLESIDKKSNTIVIENDEPILEKQSKNWANDASHNSRKRVKKQKDEDFQIE